MLQIKTKEQREKIAEILTPTSFSFSPKNSEIQVFDFISFDDMALIVDCLRAPIDSKKDVFEECWVAYRRKGSKKKSFEYWKKLSDVEKQNVMPHIKAYVSTRELQYQKDFERYLRDKLFTTIVFDKNKVVYDPTRLEKGETQSEKYMPLCDVSLMWNEYYKTYMYVGFWDGKHIPDGYSDDNRPNGASVTLNNGRGTLVWSATTKTWDKVQN